MGKEALTASRTGEDNILQDRDSIKFTVTIPGKVGLSVIGGLDTLVTLEKAKLKREKTEPSDDQKRFFEIIQGLSENFPPNLWRLKANFGRPPKTVRFVLSLGELRIINEKMRMHTENYEKMNPPNAGIQNVRRRLLALGNLNNEFEKVSGLRIDAEFTQYLDEKVGNLRNKGGV